MNKDCLIDFKDFFKNAQITLPSNFHLKI
uniref:Uncharacterized protein n=1 Tax=Lepeophtheirus salmonis TaxID=72036 RepID=A0A0K2SYX6_LEPSM